LIFFFLAFFEKTWYTKRNENFFLRKERIMKLNYKRTILVGMAFFLISAFWQAYDAIVPLILTNHFGLPQTASGAVMSVDNVLAVFLLPFLKIGCHYILLKLTGAVCGVFGVKQCTELIGDFSAAMGLVLAMTGSVCLLQLISTVCFLRGVG
jgi:hypothetical protein